jgi:hypothetical protein
MKQKTLPPFSGAGLDKVDSISFLFALLAVLPYPGSQWQGYGNALNGKSANVGK